jgi:hypothetical protein
VDRAALDVAIERGMDWGGWCPKGGWAEDFPNAPGLLPQYPRLKETPESNPLQRTEWNVRDSDATVIFSLAPLLTGGSRLARALAARYGKPFLHLHPALAAGHLLREFLERHRIRVLNVAGPRASGEAEVGAYVRQMLDEVLDAGQLP